MKTVQLREKIIQRTKLPWQNYHEIARFKQSRASRLEKFQWFSKYDLSGSFHENCTAERKNYSAIKAFFGCLQARPSVCFFAAPIVNVASLNAQSVIYSVITYLSFCSFIAKWARMPTTSPLDWTSRCLPFMDYTLGCIKGEKFVFVFVPRAARLRLITHTAWVSI